MLFSSLRVTEGSAAIQDFQMKNGLPRRYAPRNDGFIYMNFIARICFITIVLFTLSSCGEVSYSTAKQDDDSPSTSSSDDNSASDSTVFLFATDFSASGQLYELNYSDDGISVGNTGLTHLGSSAIIHYLLNELFILHSGFGTVSTDNLQVVDASNDLSISGQFSTGNGTNPHDTYIMDDQAFITLYNPSADDENIDESGDPANVIQMNKDTGTITMRYSFDDYLNDDGDKNGNAEKIIAIDDILYVCLQDLESSSFSATSSGLIGIINSTEQEINGVIELQGRNPVDIVSSQDGSMLFVANMTTFDFDSSSYEFDNAYGGLEIIDVDSGESTAFISDNDLGGYIERLLRNEDKIYAIISAYDEDDGEYLSKVIRFDDSIEDAGDIETIIPFEVDIRALFIQENYLWLSSRSSNSDSGISEPYVSIHDLESGDELDRNDLTVSGISFAGDK
jgi:hypothetical protein